MGSLLSRHKEEEERWDDVEWLLDFDRAVENGSLARVRQLRAMQPDEELMRAFHDQLRLPMIYRACLMYLRYCQFSMDEMRAVLIELLEIGFDINEASYNRSGYTPLMLAISTAHLPLCKLLLCLGASVHRSPHVVIWSGAQWRREMPLNFAVRVGPDATRLLLEFIVPASSKDDGLLIRYALREALEDHPKVLHLFMDWYERFNLPFPWEEYLDIAFIRGYEDSIVVMLQKRFSRFAENIYLEAEYFKLAAERGYVKVMRLMIAQHPQIVHKSWMRCRTTMRALRTIGLPDRPFLRWLRELQSQPFSLQFLCTYVILRRLAPNPQPKLKLLPLPPRMQDTLATERMLGRYHWDVWTD